MACLISGIGFPVSLVFALPQDGNIVGGQGTINQPTANDLVINQNTGNLIINWQGFSIGASESVRFIQPSVNSVALNRVVGTDPSLIAGRLSANGQVFITNPSGVIFLPGSQVDVHGLLATTLGISDQDFLNRTYNFFQDPSRSLASILNEGNINADFVGLLAPSVVNRGTLDASGKGAGEKGGTIHVTGENVGLFETAKLDASCDIGDGEILVGGDWLGEGEFQNAKATFIGEDVSVKADAITNGDGGKLIVFAEDSAKIYGDLSARGGAVSGNGGFIETSGKAIL